jgi:hypothetical protein
MAGAVLCGDGSPCRALLRNPVHQVAKTLPACHQEFRHASGGARLRVEAPAGHAHNCIRPDMAAHCRSAGCVRETSQEAPLQVFWLAGTFAGQAKCAGWKLSIGLCLHSLMQALSKTVQGFTLRPQSACLKVRDAKQLHAWHRVQAELPFMKD